ncbi:RNA 2',3'-cyclic phosphodiesterase [Nanobdella aerobiophila]|uniref:RNA 2',3'-cyclic phosphodiesterase n=1 Tax=Nanobdella aerobiophila TaxID=2586965 RepID=A0A915SYH2_9ARCH|nr:RNA 2',3'-cyclic phosphodiesterase [Nanobdella aerobiophila]BBL45815.1 RNA 2',3'-cyclic phosphodiesterase [Nanobdella aerobiophila]
MRIFIAIDLPEDIKKDIYNISKNIRGISGKIVEEENIHITLKFLGQINQETLNKINKKLSSINYNKFYINIGDFGYFNNRVLWIKILNKENIINLHNIIDNKLYELNIQKDIDYEPHITIYRIKNIKNDNYLKEYLNENKKIYSNILIDKFYIKESILMTHGPVYRNLYEYKLL